MTGPGGDAEELHDLAAVERGPDRLQLLLGGERLDARLEVVHPAVERARLALVARRAVAALELVQLVEQRARVAHVPAHRAVGPAHRVGVDPQVQVDELGDGLDDVLRVPQRGEALARHPGADDLVVMERRAALLERARLRLADVVQQRGEPQHEVRAHLLHDRDRVREHVLVVVDRVLLELHRVELGQELVREPGAGEEPEARRRVVDDEQLRELVADPLRAHDLEPAAVLADRGQRARARARARTRR